MDELETRVEELRGEVAALEAELARRLAAEERRLTVQEQRVTQAETRAVRGRAQLAADSQSIRLAESRRAEVFRGKMTSWRSQLWRIGHGGAALGLVCLALIPFPLAGLWFGTQSLVGLGLLELVALGASYFLIPEKR